MWHITLVTCSMRFSLSAKSSTTDPYIYILCESNTVIHFFFIYILCFDSFLKMIWLAVGNTTKQKPVFFYIKYTLLHKWHNFWQYGLQTQTVLNVSDILLGWKCTTEPCIPSESSPVWSLCTGLCTVFDYFSNYLIWPDTDTHPPSLSPWPTNKPSP